MEPSQQEMEPSHGKLWCRRAVVGIGMAVIAALLWTFTDTVEEHMGRAREMSRHTQWHVNAPVEGAQAAVLLQGGEP